MPKGAYCPVTSEVWPNAHLVRVVNDIKKNVRLTLRSWRWQLNNLNNWSFRTRIGHEIRNIVSFSTTIFREENQHGFLFHWGNVCQFFDLFEVDTEKKIQTTVIGKLFRTRQTSIDAFSCKIGTKISPFRNRKTTNLKHRDQFRVVKKNYINSRKI